MKSLDKYFIFIIIINLSKPQEFHYLIEYLIDSYYCFCFGFEYIKWYKDTYCFISPIKR